MLVPSKGYMGYKQLNLSENTCTHEAVDLRAVIYDEEYYPSEETRIARSKIYLPDVQGGVDKSKSQRKKLTHIVHL